MKALCGHTLAILCTLLPLGLLAAEGDATQPIQSTWKVQEIRYSYFGFTTQYSCDAAEQKLKSILTALGAHPATSVKASGCTLNQPSRDFFVTITTATPIPVSDLPTPTSNEAARADLIKRLGVKSEFAEEEFPATWKTVDLSRDRKLRLEPGDCELMEGLRDNVLPKLTVKVEADDVNCTPKQVSITTPALKVSALVRLPEPDKGAAAPATAER
jgi:hypothetical protein